MQDEVDLNKRNQWSKKSLDTEVTNTLLPKM